MESFPFLFWRNEEKTGIIFEHSVAYTRRRYRMSFSFFFFFNSGAKSIPLPNFSQTKLPSIWKATEKSAKSTAWWRCSWWHSNKAILKSKTTICVQSQIPPMGFWAVERPGTYNGKKYFDKIFSKMVQGQRGGCPSGRANGAAPTTVFTVMFMCG